MLLLHDAAISNVLLHLMLAVYMLLAVCMHASTAGCMYPSTAVLFSSLLAPSAKMRQNARVHSAVPVVEAGGRSTTLHLY
jgi:hypothetical protein